MDIKKPEETKRNSQSLQSISKSKFDYYLNYWEADDLSLEYSNTEYFGGIGLMQSESR